MIKKIYHSIEYCFQNFIFKKSKIFAHIENFGNDL